MNARLMTVLLLIASGITAGCSQTPSAPTVLAQSEESGRHPASMREVSERWQEDRNLAEFLILKDQWVKPGCTGKFAKEVLGEPLSTHHTEDGNQFWLYVKCDAEKEQFHSWTLLLDAEGKVKGWHCKGIM